MTLPAGEARRSRPHLHQAAPEVAPGPHNRLAIVVAICALALSAVTLLRVFGSPSAPRVPTAIAEQQAAINAAYGPDSPPTPESKPDRPVESRRPTAVDSGR